MDTIFAQLCHDLEHWETDPWAPLALLNKEILTGIVIDPCVGTGVLAEAALDKGYSVISSDIRDWGYPGTIEQDWLNREPDSLLPVSGNTVFMNPPFSKAEKFVDRAFELGARKILCFQRFSWFEGSNIKGKKRGSWWQNRMPSRIWICGDRATCWLHSVSKEQREASGGSPTAHAFFVWEQGHAPAALTGHLFKSEAL